MSGLPGRVGTWPVGKRVEPSGRSASSVEGFFLAGRSLNRLSVVSLILSSSFGLNAVFYAAWLGYLMGAWALLIQAGWALSFVLLARFSGTLRSVTGLHELLGRRFGSTTRRVASVCSIIGLTYLVGWEVSIGKSALSAPLGSVFHRGGRGELLHVGLIVGLAVLVAIAYSAGVGQRANAQVDRVLNLIKVLLLIGIVLVVLRSASLIDGFSLGHTLFPSFGVALSAIGPLGFLTSLLFNVCWQFVDNSTWQAFTSGAEVEDTRAAGTLRWSGLSVFVTVGLFGTLLGALLRSSPMVSPDNILSIAGGSMPGWAGWVGSGLLVLVLASVMSLVDGMFLSVAQSIVVDLAFAKRGWKVRLWHAKAATVMVGLASAWGISWFVQLLGGSIFDFVYVLVVVQLGLIGPVVVALVSRRCRSRFMWLPIGLSVSAGLVAVLVGSSLGAKILVDGAGTLTTVLSLLSAGLVCAWSARRNGRGSVA